MPHYRPRMAAQLSVPVWGSSNERVAQAENDSVTDFTVQVRKAALLRNDHNHADELAITVDWLDAGIDPRLMGNAIVEFYMGVEDEFGVWEPKADRRFLGIVTDVERAQDGSSRSVELKALDFTTLLIESKPYPPDGVPTYAENLEEAWARICRHAGGKDVFGAWFQSVKVLEGKLAPRGVENWPPTLSKVAPPRVKKLNTPIPVKPGSDAWAVWQQTCGMLGLISFVLNDRVIVTTSTNYYTAANPPRFIWGHNILSMRERRNCAIAGKKISLVAYDPLTQRLVQVWHPPRGEKAKKKVKGGGGAGKADDYDVFEYNGITDEGALQTVCQRVYEERSRQELEGTIITSEMFVEGLDGRQANLLKLGAGQDIRIEFEQETLDGLRGLDTIDKRVEYLIERGYRRHVAELLAKNQEALATLTPVFYMKAVRTTLEVDENGGTFEVEITYCNRIEVTGDAAS